MVLEDLVHLFDDTFHPELQEDYDNAGFLLGDPQREVTGVLTALDLTEAVVDEALAKGLNLIVTHHPFIFSGLKRITPASTTGRLVLRLVECGVAVYAAHTNLDNLMAGVNGILAANLNLADCSILRPFKGRSDVGSGMVGSLPLPIPTPSFLAEVKSLLHLQSLRVNADALSVRPSIQKVAICGGAGAFLIPDAIAAHADIFLTADLKYHDFQKSEKQIILADIGHYESEQFSKGLLAGAVDALLHGSLPVCISSVCDRWEVWL